MHVVLRLLIAVVPLVLTLGFAWLAAGPLSLGGGEKDILLAIPLLVWSFAFLCSYLVMWKRNAGLGRVVAISSVVATVAVVIAWVMLLVTVQVVSAT